MTATTITLWRDFGLAMADHLWQSTVVLALLFVLARTLRDAPPRLRNTFWRLGLLKLLLPLPLLAPLLARLTEALGNPGPARGFPRLGEIVQITWAPASALSQATGTIRNPLEPALLAFTCIWAPGVLLLVFFFRARRHQILPPPG